MSQGYSLRLRDLNRRASSKLLGVRLGRMCIKHDVPVKVLAQRMGVTRQTVYNWFAGTTSPNPALISLIESYLTHFE
jgi:transcriptional regulator with XRE-family HTH domain